MQAKEQQTASSLHGKMWSILVIMTVDMVCNSWIVFLDMDSKQVANPSQITNSQVNADKITVFVLTGVQVVMYLALMFWFFFLIWRTFPFRFGLIGRLLKEVPIVILVPVIMVIFLVEKFLRLVSVPPN